MVEGVGGAYLLWQLFRLVQRSCTGGLAIYPTSTVCGGGPYQVRNTQRALCPQFQIFFHVFMLPGILNSWVGESELVGVNVQKV